MRREDAHDSSHLRSWNPQSQCRREPERPLRTRRTAGRETINELWVIFGELHIRRGQKFNVDSYQRLPVLKIYVCHQLEEFVARYITLCIEQQLEQLSVATVIELRGIEREIDIDTAHVFRPSIRKKKIRHPTAYDDDGIVKRVEYLANIHQYAMGRLNLPVAIVAFMPRFGIHHAAAAHAGFRRCCSRASAASLPRPPA